MFNCTKARDFPLPTDPIPPMLGVGSFNGSGALVRAYSPVTLSHEWPKISRLLLMLFCSCFGSTMNGFFVASFFIEHTLRKAGNVYLACVGMADLVMTAGVTSVSAVVILSGQWDNIQVCKALQFLGLTSTYCYGIYFAFVAVENFYRVCRTPDEYAVFMSMRIDVVCLLIFFVNMGLSAAGVYMDLDYDYCERQHYGNFYFRIFTTVIVQAVPAVLTVLFLFISSIRVKRRARSQIQYKRSHLYDREYSTTSINTTAYIFFMIAWTPYVIIVHEFPNTSDAVYYNMMAIGLFRSALTSSIYGIFNMNFRRAYAHLFNYCCCKSSLSSSISNRPRRAIEYKSTIGEVRVHIMHQAVTMSHSRVTYWQETQEL
ncbi:melatonin receptor type 1B-B-like isoform X1 [Vanessa tameamea]|uniref:Melatonin receptor type 1B-B-like isoform X1 n=2 Tax=Vanessa tameamea TaxID=334116 RepID=A0A8B8IUJ3_VANTA|nr:melatonin receptor type 1B-B-like isoform X1 [Vanessa tameamea]